MHVYCVISYDCYILFLPILAIAIIYLPIHVAIITDLYAYLQ